MKVEDGYGFAPTVLLVTDGPPNEGVARGTVRTAGGRLRGAVAIADAEMWLDENAPIDAVLVEIAVDHGADLDRLLERLDHDARCGRHVGLVSVPFSLVDIAAAKLSSPDMVLVADAPLPDVALALAVMLSRVGVSPHVHEQSGDPGRLHELSQEVGRIARTLAELSGIDAVVKEPRTAFRAASPLDSADAESEINAGLVRAVIRGRRLRDQFFDSRLFADPAWDMLLDLAAARLERRQVAVSSLCIAAAVPATTALRWIKALVDEGLFVRIADPRDGRRVFIELSDAAHEGVRAYFRALHRAGIPLC